MINTIEVKAMSQEEAIKRALNILEAKEENIVKVVEIQKSKSFLGLFTKEGIYSIEIDKNKTFNNATDIQKINTSKEIEKINKSDKFEKKEFITSTTEDISDKISKTAQEIIDKIGLNLSCCVRKTNDYTYTVDLYGVDNGIIIGKKGKTLNSYEFLLNSIFKHTKIDVDVEGFKEKRTETLRELAKRTAERVIKTGKTTRLNAMPPKERKIIHEILNTYEKLETFSEGKDPKRYIVVKRKKERRKSHNAL